MSTRLPLGRVIVYTPRLQKSVRGGGLVQVRTRAYWDQNKAEVRGRPT